jgi:Pvc16 N-terminal domain
MLGTALRFLVDEANSHLRRRGLSQGGLGEVLMGAVVDDAGKWATAADNIGLTLVNVEEERIMRSQVPAHAYVNGKHVVLQPELKLNLTSLRFLSNLMTFFQAHPAFAPGAYPGLDPGIETLVVEMLALSTEQLNQLWTCLGSKYLPSVAYRVRMVVLQDVEPVGIGQPVTEITARLNIS